MENDNKINDQFDNSSLTRVILCLSNINKIDAWRKGQPTKVELVKLG